MPTSLKRRSALIITLLLSLTLTACGTILYPERKGQISGRIDPAIAVLDGIGLLFFLVPGVIAFAVDFSDGTIYLPHGKRSHLTANELKQLREGKLTASELASCIAHRDINARDLVVERAPDVKRVKQILASRAFTPSHG